MRSSLDLGLSVLYDNFNNFRPTNWIVSEIRYFSINLSPMSLPSSHISCPLTPYTSISKLLYKSYEVVRFRGSSEVYPVIPWYS